MSELESFLQRCQAFADASGLSLSTVSSKLFNDGKRLRSVGAGADLGVRLMAKAKEALEDLERQYGVTYPPSDILHSDAGQVPPAEDVAKPEPAGGTDLSREVSHA